MTKADKFFCYLAMGILIFVVALLSYQMITHEPASRLDHQNTDTAERIARRAWIEEIVSDRNKSNPRSIEIDTLPRAKNEFRTEIEGSYELDDFEDAMGRSGVRDDWTVSVYYEGDRNSEEEWEDKDNWRVGSVR